MKNQKLAGLVAATLGFGLATYSAVAPLVAPGFFGPQNLTSILFFNMGPWSALGFSGVLLLAFNHIPKSMALVVFILDIIITSLWVYLWATSPLEIGIYSVTPNIFHTISWALPGGVAVGVLLSRERGSNTAL